MTTSIDNAITTLIDLSNNIANQVRLKNWDSVQLLTEQRQRDLEVFFHMPVSIQNAKSVEKMIRSILSLDRELIGHIETEKKTAFKIFANLKNNNKAKQSYQNIASLDYR